MANPKADIYPVYFFYGPEDYLIEEEVRRTLDRTLPGGERDLGLHLFNGAEASIGELVQTARTMPMFSRLRVIVLKDADLIDQEELKAILEYMKNPSPDACLVLCGQTPGPWARYLGEIEKIGKVKEYPRLKGRGLILWLIKRMAEIGKKLSEEAAEYMVEVSGDHLQDLSHTLEKAFLGAGGKKEIGLEDVEGLVSDVKVSTVYDLMDAIGNRDLEKALGILEKAMQSKTIPFRKEEGLPKRMDDPSPLLLSMMAKQYRNIWRVKEATSKERGIAEAARELRISPWNVQKMADQGRHFPESSLREGIMKCYRTDRLLKRGHAPKDLLMEKLVIELCRPGHPSSPVPRNKVRDGI